MSLKRNRPPSPTLPSSIFRSSTVEEQKSVFVAAFSPSLSTAELQNLAEFKSATHKIAAWRKRSRQLSLTPSSQTLYDLGHDDDGEKWAGWRLGNVLKNGQVEGTVVVARWYGGQNIGPVRFTHIENCAKEAIEKWRVADSAAEKREQVIKKNKKTQQLQEEEEVVVESQRQKSMVEETLRERDYSITVLRKLLAEKKAKLHDEEPVPPTPPKPQGYESMSMEALLRVEKARDATIAFTLKQIDKVEEELQLVDVIEEAMQDAQADTEEKEENRKKEKKKIEQHINHVPSKPR